jgi:hypothetical protein
MMILAEVDLGTWILGAVTLAIGSVLSLLSEALRRRWTKADAAENFLRGLDAEKRRRVEERSEEAARDIVQDLRGLRDLYIRSYVSGEHSPVSDAHLKVVEQRTVSIADPVARQRLEQVVDVLRNLDAVEERHGDPGSRVVWRVAKIGMDTAGVAARGEPVIGNAEGLSEYVGAVEQYREAMDASIAYAEERQREGGRSKTDS